MEGFQAFWADYGEDILSSLLEHLYLVAAAMGIACLIAIPVGVMLARSRIKALRAGVIGLANVIQTIPSIALIGLILTMLLGLNEVLRGAGMSIQTIGLVPGLMALTAYALLPILRNTYTGIRQVSPDVIEVARGMGMTPRQILWKVEMPLALPVIMAGIRISTVWTVGVAALVSLVGAGGLGDLIFAGIKTQRDELILAGAIPAALLALVLDLVLGLTENILTPKGMEKSNVKA